ncbi:MAG: lysozyme [Hyphomicrobium sp.]|jgi:lysozyme
MHTFYLDAIRNFEGFTPRATADYAQVSNGFGTRAHFAGEVIDRAEAERRFQSEVANARSIVERNAPHLDEGTKAALTSLTYNSGPAWTKSGLGAAVARGDLDQVREIFQQYNKAGGEVLPGLVSRRSAEALWIGNPDPHGTVAGSNSPVVSAAVQAAADVHESGPRTAAESTPGFAVPLRSNPVNHAVSAFLRAAANPVVGSEHAASPPDAAVSIDALLAASGVEQGDLRSSGILGSLPDVGRYVRLESAVELRARPDQRHGDRV